jgi:hypothetical protein
MTTTMSELKPPGDIECGIVRPVKTVMGDFLVAVSSAYRWTTFRARPSPTPSIHTTEAYHHG